MVLDIKFNTSFSKPKSANTTVSLLLAASQDISNMPPKILLID